MWRAALLSRGTFVLIVNEFEPNRRLATVLQFLILAVGAAAIVRRLLH